MMTQIAQRGSMVLPDEMRSEYKIMPGDIFTIIPLGEDRFLLVKGKSQVDVIADELSVSLQSKGATLAEMLKSAQEIRAKNSPDLLV